MENDPSDIDLVDACLAGNEKAYELLISRYTDKAYRLAMRITRKNEDAEEVVQEVLITVYRKLASFKREAAFSTWFFRITVNTALMKLRNRKKHLSYSLNEAIANDNEEFYTVRSDTSDVHYMSIRHELRKLLQDAIDSLDSEYKTIFVLRDVDGLSNKEVSSITNLSVSAVKSRLHRCRIQLRDILAEYYQAGKKVSQLKELSAQDLENLANS